MGLNLPAEASAVSNRAKVDVKRELRDSNPFLARGFLPGIIVGLGNRVFEFFLSMKDMELEVTPLRAIRQFQAWATSYGFTNNVGASAAGKIWINASGGGLNQTIPDLTVYVSSDGLEYIQQGDALLAPDSIAVTSATVVGTTATLTTSVAHNLSSNAVVTISGANEPGYNQALTKIQVLSETTFSYTVPTGTPAAATGTLNLDVFGAVATVNASEPGVESNQVANAELSFETPFGSGVETVVGVAWTAITRGAEDEDDEDMRGRLISSLQNPVANYNDDQIDAVCKTVSGVTRTFVQKATPAKGQVTIYFMRDNDDDPIPTSGDVANVVSALASIRPAPMAPADEIVAAPTPAVSGGQNFLFSAISPDTPTMRKAIEDQLEDYFDVVPEVATDVTQDAYRGAILNTIDTSTGARLVSFTLTTPASGSIVVAAGEIATLGTVTFQ